MKKRRSVSRSVSVILATVMVTQSLASISFAYKDTSDHWAEPHIERLSGEEILKGYDDDTFAPNRYISREETAAVIDRTIKSRNVAIGNEEKNVALSDIEGRWSTDSIKSLVSKGIIEGYPGGTFNPTGKITRQEAAKIVFGILNPEAKDGKAVNFNDIEDQWGKDFIKRLASLGIINGYGDGIFKPNNYITRAELAKIISEILDRENELLVKEKEEKPVDPEKPVTPEKPETPEKPDTPDTPGGGSTYKPDFAKLDQAIKRAENADLDGKTEESVEALQDALENAKNVRKNSKAPKKDIEDAVKRLNAAIDGLEDISVLENKAPVIIANDKRLSIGDSVNLLDGVSASDEEDGDLTSKIKVIGEVPVKDGKANKTGEYTITYSVTDSGEKTAEKTVKFTVVSNDKSGLKIAIENAEKADTSDKTEESVSKLNEELQKAKAVHEDPDAAKEDIKKAIDDLNAAVNGLEVKKSSSTEIELKEDAEAGISVDNDKGQIHVYSHKEDGTQYKYSDLIAELKSKDGSVQEYKAIESGFMGDKDLDPDTEITAGTKIEVKSEDGKETAKYTVFPTLREQAPPSGLGTDPGKITNVTSDMEYKPRIGTNWTSVDGEEVSGLEAGEYQVRYKAKPGYKESNSTSVTVEEYLSDNTDIKRKEGAKIVIKADNDEYEIHVYSHHADGTAAKYSDIKSELESTDGSNQTYESMDKDWENLSDDADIENGSRIAIVAADNSEITYDVIVTLREQGAPKNLGTEPGKITNVTSEMEWKEKNGTVWTSVDGEEIAGLDAGEYQVRYKAKPGYKESTSTSVTVEAQAQSANTGLKVIENKDVVSSVDIAGANIRVFYVKDNGDRATFNDMLAELEAEDGSNQTYQLTLSGGMFTQPHMLIATGYELHVTSERGTSKTYKITPIKRLRRPPTGLTAVDKTSTEGGKILGVDNQMEYRKSTEEYGWKNVVGTKIDNLDAGSYDVRYKTNTHYTPSAFVTLEIKEAALSDNTDIAAIDGATTIDKISKVTKKIHLYQYKDDGTAVTYADVVAELKSTDGSNQTYKALETYRTNEKALTAPVTKWERIKVVAENGTTEFIYTVDVALKPLAPPTGLVAHPKTADSLGKITGVDDTMQYIKKDPDNPTFWADVPSGKTEITNLEPGEYEVRYRKTSSNAASSSVVLVIEDQSTAPDMPEEIELAISPEHPGIIDDIDLDMAFVFEGKTPAEIKRALIVVGDPNAEVKIMDYDYGNKLVKDDDDPIQSGDEMIITRSDGKTATIPIYEA